MADSYLRKTCVKMASSNRSSIWLASKLENCISC